MKHGKPIDYEVIWEDWDVYKLENNLRIRVKTPISRITDTGKRDEKQKTGLFEFDGQTIVRVEGECELHDPSPDVTLDEKKDLVKKLTFEPLVEGVQIYHIPKFKQLVLVKYIPQEVWETTKFDQDGMPIFKVNGKITTTGMLIPHYEMPKDP